MTHYDVNIVMLDYSAPTDGTSSCATAWTAFGTFLSGLNPGDSVTLLVPNSGAGGADTYYLGPDGIPLAPGIIGGISVIVNMEGVTLTGNFYLGNVIATYDNNTTSSRADNISAGATSVTVADSSIFTEGQYVAIGGIDLQAGGSPPDPGLLEYRSVTISGNVLSFTEPLVNSYKSTWPLFDGGTSGQPDEGGPATVWYLNPAWDVDVTYNATGGGWSRLGATLQIYTKCRKITVNGGTAQGPGIVPTVTGELILTGGVVNGDQEIEFDKMVSAFTSIGTTWEQWKVQSVSTCNWTMVGDTVANAAIGFTKKFSATDCTFGGQFYTGPVAFGFADEVRISGGSMAGPLHVPDLTDDISGWDWQGGGVFRTDTPVVPITGLKRLTTIFAWFTFEGSRNFGNPFQVTDAWQDATYTYCQTTLPAVPTFDLGSSGLSAPDKWAVVPCLHVYFSGVSTSDSDILALNNAPQGYPFYTYNERPFFGPQSGSDVQTFSVVGNLQKIVIDVSVAYTGAQSTCHLLLDQFGFFLLDDTNTVTRTSGLYVNLKVAGTRTITPTGVINAQTGDNLDVIAGWLMSGMSPLVDANTTGDTDPQQAVARFQVFTDQGTPGPNSGTVVPISLGLHS